MMTKGLKTSLGKSLTWKSIPKYINTNIKAILKINLPKSWEFRNKKLFISHLSPTHLKKKKDNKGK